MSYSKYILQLIELGLNSFKIEIIIYKTKLE